MRALCLLAVLSLYLSCATAAVVRGTVSSDHGFAFLARFCFDYNPGAGPSGEFMLKVSGNQLTNSSADPRLKWAIYDDEEVSWPRVQEFKQQWTCTQLGQFDTTKGPAFGKSAFTELDGNGWSSSRSVNINQHLRPRFWFLALLACDEPHNTPIPMVDVQYEVHFVNNLQSQWDREFGSNERGLNTCYLIFAILYTVFIAVQLWGVRALKVELGFVHPIVKLFTAAVSVEYLAVLLSAIHYLAFGADGVGVMWLSYIGDILGLVSRVLFILVLLLLAHGWTISTDHLEARRTIAGVVALFLSLQISVLGFQWGSYDPELTSVTKVDLVLQLLVIAGYLAFGLYFLVMVFGVRYRKESVPAKKTLYTRLGSLFSLWLLGPPLVAIGVLLLDDWVRLKIVESVNLTLTAVAYAILAFLLWPSRAQDYFRIHIDPDHSGVELSDFNGAEGQPEGHDTASYQQYTAM